MTLATRVRTLREAMKESLQQTADAIGVSKGHLWQIERGKVQGPALTVIEALASHFGTSVSFLIGEAVSEGEDPELVGMFRDAQSFSDREREILRSMMKTLKQQADRASE